jgi:hypothetical protein
MRKEDMVFNLDGKLPEGEVFDLSEYVLAITKKDWVCGTDYNPNIQMVAIFEIIDRSEYDLMDEKDNPDFPYMVESSVFAHPKFFSKKFMDSFKEEDVIEDNDGKYPIYYALYDAYMYMGGIHVNSETVQSVHTCDIETEVVVSDGKFRHFKTFEDAEKYIRGVYVPNMEAIMGMIGLYLDRHWNRIGTTGWDSIYTMTQGKDLFTPAFDRMKEELKGHKEEDEE